MDRPGREGYIQMMLKRAAARRNPPASSNIAAPAAGVRSLDGGVVVERRYMSDGEYVIFGATELPSPIPRVRRP